MFKIKYQMNSKIRNFRTKEFYGEAQDKVAKFSSHVLLAELQHGSVMIAIIASNMNSSNPNVGVIKKGLANLAYRSSLGKRKVLQQIQELLQSIYCKVSCRNI